MMKNLLTVKLDTLKKKLEGIKQEIDLRLLCLHSSGSERK